MKKKKKPVAPCPNCGRYAGHVPFCQQKAVWELEERASELEATVQLERTKTIKLQKYIQVQEKHWKGD